MSRTSWWTGACAWVLVAGVLAMCGNGVSAEEIVNVVHYGGSFGKALREAMFDPAEKALKVRVNDVSRTDMAKIKAMVSSGHVEWDVANVNTLEVWRGVKEGLWEPIDYTIVNRAVAGSAKEREYGVPFIGIANGLVYSTKTYASPSQAPQSWVDFWDVSRFPGPRALEDRVRYTLMFALEADGVPPNKLFPLDVDRAFRKLDQIKPHITVWSKPPVQAIDLIATGQVVMAFAPNNEWAEAVRHGAPIGWQWNQALYTTNAWTVLKGTQHKRAAMLLIREMTRPQPEARLAELTYFGPMNPSALPLVSANVRAYLPTTPENLKKEAVFDHEWWGAHEAELIERWNSWLHK